MKRIPVLPTLIVLIAVGYMIHLGFWQLDRLKQKDAMLALYASAQANPAAHRWPAGDIVPLSFSKVMTRCAGTGAFSAKSGRNAAGESGWAHVADCRTADGAHARVVLGWSTNPAPVSWAGGEMTGVFLVQPGGKVDIVADPPLAGLAANARPDPAQIPNNHLAYAVQWFLFAGVALAIYALALRNRMRPSG
jgi:surfeit locus 1 family protein